MSRHVPCIAGKEHTDISSAGGETQACDPRCTRTFCFLGSLRLPYTCKPGRWKAKQPTCPISCTGVEGTLPMGAAGMKLPPPGFVHLSTVPQPAPGQGCTAPAAGGRGSQQLPRVHVSSQHSSRSSSNLSDLGGWTAANCHHCILSRPRCKAKAVLPLGELKGGKKKNEGRKERKKKKSCLASLTAFG